MLGCGIIGYLLRKLNFPLAPLVLGLILGPQIEKSMRTSLEMSAGDFSIFFTRPICVAMLALAVVILAFAALHFGPKEIRDPNAD
jgi:putative tricarboxylic transport membrane protein